MRTFLAFVSVYVLFVVQSLAPAGGPNLVLAAVVAIALHEGRLSATLAGVFGGLCLDLAAPATTGAGMAVLGLAGYAAASLRVVVYRGAWVMPAMTGLGQLVLLAVLALAGAGAPAFIPAAVSLVLTALFSIPLGAALSRVLYRP